MSKTVNYLSIDPGLANLGVIVARSGDRWPTVVHAAVWTSKPTPRCRDKNEDKITRTRALSRWLTYMFDTHKPVAIACEGLSYFRGVHANVCAGLVWGALSTLIEARGLPVVTAQSSVWRGVVRGDLGLPKSAPETRIHAGLLDIVPGARAAVEAINPAGNRAHVLDAVGVSAWAAHQDVIRAVLGAA